MIQYEFICKQYTQKTKEWQPWVSTISPNLNFSPPISSRFNRSTFVNRSCSPCLVVSPSWNLPKPQGEDCEGHVCRSYSRTSRASATSSNLLQMCELAYGSNQCCIFWNGLHKDFKPWLVWSSRICWKYTKMTAVDRLPATKKSFGSLHKSMLLRWVFLFGLISRG